MRIGIGLPAGVPGTDVEVVGKWTAEAEARGFRSLGVIDRLVYDNLDPVVALSFAAAETERIELVSTVLNTGYHRSPVVLAKQLASLERLSGGRLTVGLGMGAWPDDYNVTEVPMTGRGAAFEATIATFQRVWRGELSGAAGPISALPDGRPGLLLAGMVPAGLSRAARLSDGWLAPAFSIDLLTGGTQAVRAEWERAGRPGSPRIVAVRYFGLGDGAQETAETYAEHYYGPEMFAQLRGDLITDTAKLATEVAQIAAAGADDLMLLPTSGSSDQVGLLADALDEVGWGDDSRSGE